ncbi:type II secretion system protein [Ramlibacter sp. G-1-2-2]|uniref:Type II secretion system protein n=1 Tax=Ramlibacter agri TaxID=2728837 RepID=A0A848GY20_9BURK|nr:type II secretion system protein [Ramlibacter agri]NML43475.1 type II secretion system protein [Ramlibacter agri]
MKRASAAFTLVEMLVTLALVGIAATVVLPYAALVEARAKESELRLSLRTLRQAIDQYKAAADAGLIEKKTGDSGYPSSLESLVNGVPRSTAFGISVTPVVFLRRIPRDPFFPDRTVPASETWNLRAYGSPPGDFSRGNDVFDVSSKAGGSALDGSQLGDW